MLPNLWKLILDLWKQMKDFFWEQTDVPLGASVSLIPTQLLKHLLFKQLPKILLKFVIEKQSKKSVLIPAIKADEQCSR